MARASANCRKRLRKRGGVHIHRQYTIEEAARATGTCRGTVRRWIKHGLPAIKNERPIIILGEDLAHFLRDRRKSKSCALNECYCCKCGEPRKPALGIVDYIPKTSKRGLLRGLCEGCSGWIVKGVSAAALPEIRQLLDVSIPQAQQHLAGSTIPIQNDHFDKDSKTDAKTPSQK